MRNVNRSSLLELNNVLFSQETYDFCFLTLSRSPSCFVAGAHHPGHATYLFSCNGVFRSKIIFRLNFPLMRLPQEPDDQLQEINHNYNGRE